MVLDWYSVVVSPEEAVSSSPQRYASQGLWSRLGHGMVQYRGQMLKLWPESKSERFRYYIITHQSGQSTNCLYLAL